MIIDICKLLDRDITMPVTSISYAGHWAEM